MFTNPSSRFGSEHPTIMEMQLEDYKLLDAAAAKLQVPVGEAAASRATAHYPDGLAALKEFLGRLRVRRPAPS